MGRIRARAAVVALILLATPLGPSPSGADTNGSSAPLAEPYRAGDRSVTALNILPPGQGGYLNGPDLAAVQGGAAPPDHFIDQRTLYADLIEDVGAISPQTLGQYFKDASFGVPQSDIARTYSPRPGVDVIRDKSYNVPHVYGATRSDTMFGAGYVSAEDRMFMMDVLRHTGRGRLTEFLGPNPAYIAMDCAQWRVADYSEAELQAMIDELPAGADQFLAAQARQDVLDYTAGVNAYIAEVRSDPSKLPGEYPALQLTLEDWKPTDTVAVASLIGGQLGVGGGGELRNAIFLNDLVQAGHTRSQARTMLNDLRLVDDPEAPSTTDRSFPWNLGLGAVDPASVAVPDSNADPDGPDVTDEDAVVEDSCPDSGGDPPIVLPLTVDGPFGPIDLMLPKGASNALLVGSQESKSGRPLAVFGPQVGYWSPEILMELDLHGPGIAARGVGFPGISMYVLLGRGDRYGYSATSADGDQVDVRVVKLCDPAGGTPTIQSTHYLRHDGQCAPIIQRTETFFAKTTADSPNSPPQLMTMRTERVELPGIPGSTGMRGGSVGIIQARGTIGGAPVAFARQRVSYGGEVDSALTYIEIMNPDVINAAADFQRAFARFNFTFNWFYVDGQDIAYQLGGAHPLRAPGTDPDLPVWNDTRWAWPGLLSFEGTPKDISPAKGYITSWNNKQAPGFRSSDSNWGFAPVDRVLPLNDGIEGAIAGSDKVDLAGLVRVMADAATVDLRGYRVLPVLLDVIGDPGTERLRTVVDLLKAWNASGAHRRDENGDGEYEHEAAISVMDEWWTRAVEAVFGSTLGVPVTKVPYTRDDAVNSAYALRSGQAPDQNGSSFNDGFYGHVDKDLRSVLGRPVQSPFSRQYCGGGSLAECRAALLASLDASVTAVETEPNQTADPATWDVQEAAEQITFSELGVQGVDPIPWQNRPTFQQVLEFRAPPPAEKNDDDKEDQKQDSVAEQVAKLVALCLSDSAGAPQILGTDGPDVLTGTAARDIICGFGGDDRIAGLGGNDVLVGGTGPDWVGGGRGRDRIVGQGGSDRLLGHGGRDALFGGAGRDRCRGGPGSDVGYGCNRGRV